MDNFQKSEIQQLLQKKVDSAKNKGMSQKTFAHTMIGISEANIINILKGNWKSISDAMWQNIGKQVGYNTYSKWSMAETRPFKAFIKLLTTAQNNALAQAICMPSGRGKSFGLKWLRAHHENVIHITCTKLMSNKEVLASILKAMGKTAIGTAQVMMDTIIENVLKLKNPIIILDEFDKLRDDQKLFFITLYNMLEDYCALMIIGTHNMEYQIKHKTGKHRIGFEEIYSRINRKFITLPDCNLKDVTMICEANGLTDAEKITHIYNESEGDLRRVRTGVRIALLKQKEEQSQNAA